MNNGWRSLGVDGAVIVLLTVLAYMPAMHAGFVWDDYYLITENRMVKASDGPYRFWFTSEAADYRPVTWSLWWLEWRLWDRTPTGYRVVNVSLHAVNTVLVWLVLRRLKIPGAWLAAAVFAVHPVNVATVGWISEQKNTLSMLFYALSILLYLRFDEEGSAQLREATISARPSVSPRWGESPSHGAVAPYRRPLKKRSEVGLDSVHDTRAGRRASRAPSGWMWYGLSLVAGLLALLSKTAVVMLPVVLLGCMWWRHGTVRRRDWFCSGPFFVASLVLSLVTILQHQQGLPEAVRTGGFAARLAVAGWIPWFHLSKALVPISLTVIYPKWEVDASRWVSYVPGVILIGCFVVFWWKRRTWGRPLLFGLGYFVVMLFPVLGFFDQGFYRLSLVADHWQYHAIIGVIALAVAGGQWICGQMDRKGWRVGVPAPLGPGLMGAAVVMVLGAAAWSRACVYVSAETLWRDNVAKSPGAWPQYYLGCALQGMGRLDEAIGHFDEALRLKPDLADAHNNLGMVLRRMGRLPEAIEHYQQALRIKPDLAEAHDNWGLALFQLGRSSEAMEQWEQALRIKPDDAGAHNNLGVTLAQAGKFDDAIGHYEQALRIKPDFAEVHYGLGVALERTGRLEEGIGHLDQAVRLRPNFAEAQKSLERLRAELALRTVGKTRTTR